MDLSNKQKQQVHNLLQKKLSFYYKRKTKLEKRQEVLSLFDDDLWNEGEHNFSHNTKLEIELQILRDKIELDKLNDQLTNSFLKYVDQGVKNSNKEFSYLRGIFRKLRRWNLYYMQNLSYEKLYIEMMTIIKKEMQGHETRFFYQDKVCIKCKFPLDEKKQRVKRGYLCRECFEPEEMPTDE